MFLMIRLTNHYFSTVFEENASATISGWNAEARESEESRTPWSLLRQNARQYYTAHDMLLQRKMQSFGLVRLAKGLPVVDSLKNMIQAKSIIMVAFTVLVI